MSQDPFQGMVDLYTKINELEQEIEYQKELKMMHGIYGFILGGLGKDKFREVVNFARDSEQNPSTTAVETLLGSLSFNK